MEHKKIPTKTELKKKLTDLQYKVTQEKGTEIPFSGEYCELREKGTYECIVCRNQLFLSETKFDSGTGWPSFFAPLDEKNIETEIDENHGMLRTEVKCSQCGAHLGHVFNDGPMPTKLRYCMNSAALKFIKKLYSSAIKNYNSV